MNKKILFIAVLFIGAIFASIISVPQKAKAASAPATASISTTITGVAGWPSCAASNTYSYLSSAYPNAPKMLYTIKGGVNSINSSWIFDADYGHTSGITFALGTGFSGMSNFYDAGALSAYGCYEINITVQYPVIPEGSSVTYKPYFYSYAPNGLGAGLYAWNLPATSYFNPIKPIALFTYTKNDNTVNFDASSSSSPSGLPITSYLWNFGDNNQGSGGPVIQHTYNSSGPFTVQLWVATSNASSNPYQSIVNNLTVTLNVESSDGNGTVSGGGVGAIGSKLSISASPKAGYEFDKWVIISGGGSIENSSSANTVVTLISNATVMAYFKLIPSIPLPTISFSASPASISYNGTTVLTWNSSNATSCTINPGNWTGISGTQPVNNLTATTTYTATCTGPGGSASKNVTVTVGSAPTAPTTNTYPPQPNINNCPYTELPAGTKNFTFNWNNVFDAEDGYITNYHFILTDSTAPTGLACRRDDYNAISPYAITSGNCGIDGLENGHAYTAKVEVTDSDGNKTISQNCYFSIAAAPSYTYSWVTDAWGVCNQSGGYLQTRTCNNPAPLYGGTECQRIDGSLTTPTNRDDTRSCTPSSAVSNLIFSASLQRGNQTLTGVNGGGITIVQDGNNYDICSDKTKCSTPVRAGDDVILDFYLVDTDGAIFANGEYTTQCTLINPDTGVESICSSTINPSIVAGKQKAVIHLIESGIIKLKITGNGDGSTFNKNITIRVPRIKSF
ncbi:MAG TPA: PKD domain-containing protein [Patescibacteria group bacterium]|nr:PKD domain-containing protein [Patescibacteria group bacterium]